MLNNAAGQAMASKRTVSKEHLFEACVVLPCENDLKYVMCQHRLGSNNDSVVLLLRRVGPRYSRNAPARVGVKVRINLWQQRISFYCGSRTRQTKHSAFNTVRTLASACQVINHDGS
jgi:hypothetical protein